MLTKDIQVFINLMEKFPKIEENDLKQAGQDLYLFFTQLLPKYKEIQAKKGQKWEGKMNFGGGMREQDGLNWSSSEYVEIGSRIILTYKYDSLSDRQEFSQECIAYMQDENTLEKVTYFHCENEKCSCGKQKEVLLHRAEIDFFNNEARALAAEKNGIKRSFELEL